jgi:hypothetical protein
VIGSTSGAGSWGDVGESAGDIGRSAEGSGEVA